MTVDYSFAVRDDEEGPGPLVHNERPILFSTPMVQALLCDMKGMTRRIVKWPSWITDIDRAALQINQSGAVGEFVDGKVRRYLACPHGGIGDRLWVRESWCALDREFHPLRGSLVGLDGFNVAYRADHQDQAHGDGPDQMRWRPSIHMRREHSRITLEITNTRVERLQAITEEDAEREGFPGMTAPTILRIPARIRFEELWCEINGPDSWAANPWVWVVSFKRIEARRAEVGG